MHTRQNSTKPNKTRQILAESPSETDPEMQHFTHEYPTKPDKTRQISANLNMEQDSAIDLLVQGSSDRVVAEAVKVRRLFTSPNGFPG
jgi:hypothetical protein